MNYLDKLKAGVKSKLEEQRYAKAYPDQYREELSSQRKSLEHAQKVQEEIRAEKKRISELKRPAVITATKNYLQGLKTNKVKAKVFERGEQKGGVFGSANKMTGAKNITATKTSGEKNIFNRL